ncbi:MAG: signal peptide peptidase SppA, partial [Rhodanobacteraceae bacterium]
NYSVRYIEPPTSPLQRFLLGIGNSASMRALSSLGVHVPAAWMIAAPKLLPDLGFLRDAQAGKPLTYAYCFCRLQP